MTDIRQFLYKTQFIPDALKEFKPHYSRGWFVMNFIFGLLAAYYLYSLAVGENMPPFAGAVGWGAIVFLIFRIGTTIRKVEFDSNIIVRYYFLPKRTIQFNELVTVKLPKIITNKGNVEIKDFENFEVLQESFIYMQQHGIIEKGIITNFSRTKTDIRAEFTIKNILLSLGTIFFVAEEIRAYQTNTSAIWIILLILYAVSEVVFRFINGEQHNG
jgi:hypothetical protein